MMPLLSLKVAFVPLRDFLHHHIALFRSHLVCGVNFLLYAVMGNDLAGF